MYECMMQQIPDTVRCSKEEKRLKAQYAGTLKEYMREYGCGSIIKRVLNSLDRFLFDEFIFCNEEHRDLFWKMHGKCVKTDKRLDFGKAAVIYLLSADRVFGTILGNYVSNPIYILPKMYNGSNGEEQYNLYHAVRMLAGMETGLAEDDLTEDGVIDDKILCLIINAKFIEKYGISGYKDKRKRKQSYVNNPMNRRQNTYSYKGQTIRIKQGR